jgi:serine/threonine-protein phosphatase 6 catalytic subunit
VATKAVIAIPITTIRTVSFRTATTMSPYNSDRWIEQLMRCEYLPESDMKILCNCVQEILMEESNIQPVSSPVTICGDIHGQFWDLLQLLREGGDLPETSYIFMGSACYLGSRIAGEIKSLSICRVISWIEDITAWRQCLYYSLSRPGWLFWVQNIASESNIILRYPDKVTLLRGNHESRQITQVYGFYGMSLSTQV